MLEVFILRYEFKNPEQALLEKNDSDEKVEVYYADNPCPFLLPEIGPRPPYYTNQRFEQECPLI